MMNRRGFTLVETIVTVGLIAVLAAFVVPTVIQKAGTSDPVKVQNDAQSVGTALQTFANDTRAGFPALLFNLTNKPTISDRNVDNVSVLTAAQVGAWNGPYLGTTATPTPTDSFPTGYTAFMRNRLVRYDVVNDKAESDPSGAGTPLYTGSGWNGTAGANAFSTTNTIFVAVQIVGLTPAQAQLVNRNVDGPNDVATNVAGVGTVNWTGRFRFGPVIGAGAMSGTVTAYFLSVPIAQ